MMSGSFELGAAGAGRPRFGSTTTVGVMVTEGAAGAGVANGAGAATKYAAPAHPF